MSHTNRTILPTLVLSGEAPSSLTPYEESLQKISRVRQFVVEMDLINCQNAYAQVLRQWLKRTEEFNDALWVKTDATVIANTFIAPDGTITADTLQFSAIDGSVSQTGQN